MEEYVYQSLKTSHHIRLLHLQPATEDHAEAVLCNITQSSLDDNPIYEALSYTWQLDDDEPQEEDQQSIRCDGRLLYASPNLLAALRRLRPRSTPRTLWADAICINQNDLLERSQQVQIMDQVYAKACRVIAWLGASKPSDTGTYEAFSMVYNYARSRLDEGDRSFSSARQDMHDTNYTALPNTFDTKWTAIGSFFSKRWFSRVWIIQEIVMARNITFVCGEIEIEQPQVELVQNMLRKSGLYIQPPISRGLPGYRMIDTVTSLAKHRRDGTSWDLRSIFECTRNFNASHPRDKLYALLGIINDKPSPVFIPDYNISDQQLYRQWSKYSLTSETSLGALSFIRPQGGWSNLNMPSWVKNWGGSIPYHPFPADQYTTLKDFPPSIRFCDNGEVLILRGVILDIVMKVIAESVPLPAEVDKLDMPTVQAMLLPINNFVNRCESLVAESLAPLPTLENFCQTLVCDRIPDSSDVDRLVDSYHAWKLMNFHLLRNGRFPEGYDANMRQEIGSRTYVFELGMKTWLEDRTFGITHGLRMGMFPTSTTHGDIVCAFSGALTPHVIRLRAAGGYEFVGECYVHGLMYGEASESPSFEERFEDISLH